MTAPNQMSVPEFEPGKAGIPWDHRTRDGLFPALFNTTKLILSQPQQFFTQVDFRQPSSSAILYYLSICVPITIILSIIILIFTANQPKALQDIAMSFLGIVLGLPMGAVISHIGVWLLKGAGGWRQTLQVTAFSAVTNIFLLVPYLGTLIAVIGSFFLLVIGLKVVHKFSTIKALGALLLVPGILFIISLLAALFLPLLGISPPASPPAWTAS